MMFSFCPKTTVIELSWELMKRKTYKCCACKSMYNIFYLYTYPCRIFPKGIVVYLQTYRWKTSGCFQSEMMPKPCQLKTAWCLPWETIGWMWTVKMVCEVNSRLHSEQGAGKQTFRELTLEVIRKELFEKQMLLQLSFPETHVCSIDARCVWRNVLC